MNDDLIKRLYKGDVQLYEQTMRNTMDYVPIPEALDLKLSWQTIQTAAACYPEYEETSLFVIDNFLDYIPSPAIYIPHQSFIKSCIAGHYRGELDEPQLIKELEFHCKRTRNDDMKKYGWANDQQYTEADYRLYETHLGIYKQKARQRLCEMINCEPPLEYSLGAEIYLRQVFQDDDYHDDQPYTIFENRAVTIGAYREALISLGQAAADDSPLMGQALCDYTGVSPFSRLPIKT